MRQTKRWVHPRPPPPGGKNQLSFSWDTASVPAATPITPPNAPTPAIDNAPPPIADWLGHPAEVSTNAKSPTPEPAPQPGPPTVRLRWDFEQTFPEPLEQAIAAGLLQEEDGEPEALRGLHAEHAREVMALLARIEVVADARRRTVDPDTGRRPRTEKGRAALRDRLAQEPERLQHTLTLLIDVYAEAFGDEAATCFRTACESRHKGYKVVADKRLTPLSLSVRRKRPPDEPGWVGPECPAPFPESTEDDGLPLARPLRSAVAAGVFGFEDDGRPVEPSAEEVDAISRPIVEQLMVAFLPPATGADGIREILRPYEQDFVAEAAARLERHALALARSEQSEEEEGEADEKVGEGRELSREAAAVIGAAGVAQDIPSRKKASRRRKRR